ncbi:MAG: hypothetical protein JEZ04_06735 [Spirochaetales bacterium]|nr:hypothetical protein [Spirochaetales bacterium]
MITWIYRLIVLLVSIFVVVNLVSKEKIKDQANAVIVLIPLLLRLLMIK